MVPLWVTASRIVKKTLKAKQVPLLALGVNPLVAAKLACFASGIPALVGIKKLCGLFRLEPVMETAVLLSSVVLVLSFFVQLISPDLLVAGILSLYLAKILDENAGAKKYDGASCGALGALGYFAKSYAMPFFVVHFSVVCLLRRHWATDAQVRVRFLKTWLYGMAVFALLCAPWISLLSVKYGKFTVNTTGAYNRAVVGPGYSGHPVAYEGFFKPANQFAVSVWEDPSQIPVRPWSMLDSAGDFWHQVKLVATNIMAEMDAFQSVSFFSLVILLALAVLVLESGETARFAGLTLFSIVLYGAGYIPIVVRARYLFPVYILLLVAGAKLLGEIIGRVKVGRAQSRLMLGVFCASFLLSPALNIAGAINESKDAHIIAEKLGPVIGSGRTLATNARWMETLYVASLTGSRYVGQAGSGMTPKVASISLAMMGADYFIAWPDNTLHPEGWVEISGGQLPGLLVFAPPQSVAQKP